MKINFTYFVSILFFASIKLSAQTNVDDSLALVDLYDSTNSSYTWDKSTNWKTIHPVSTWYGITTANSRVVKIELGGAGHSPTNYLLGNGLNGSIPASIGNLTALETLDLSYNWINGSVPTTIGNLTSLKNLKLGGTPNGRAYINFYLTGVIPVTIEKLVNLENLFLSHCSIKDTIPSGIGSLTKLRTLDLSSTDLYGTIPNSIGKLSSLSSLNLKNVNDLSGSLPTELGSMFNLQSLIIGCEFNYGVTSITGTIPSSFGNLRRLRFLDLGFNRLTGIPASLGDLDSLETLILTYNQIAGSLPSSLGNLSSLKRLDISYNGLTGSVPSTFGNLHQLQRLELNNNELTGSIPNALGGHAYSLILSNNLLSGPLPSSLSNCSSLMLNNNLLTGSLPTSFAKSTTLQIINLANNKLNSSIPSEIGNNPALKTLDLSANELTGSVPASLGSVNTARYVYLQNNKLSGSIPVFKYYPVLYIGGNRFVFAGIEELASQTTADTTSLIYSPQAPISIRQQNNKLSVSIGGTPANNTFKWYKVGFGLAKTNVADSSFTPPSGGYYYVVATNSVAKKLTLYSDTVAVDTGIVNTCPGGSAVITAGITGTNYQWQLNDGSGFIMIKEGGNYAGTTTPNLHLNNMPSTAYGFVYRCIVDEINSHVFKLIFSATSTGATNSPWEAPSSWSCGKVPDSNTDVIIETGSVILNSNGTCRSLQLNPGVSLVVTNGSVLTITH